MSYRRSRRGLSRIKVRGRPLDGSAGVSIFRRGPVAVRDFYPLSE